MTLVPHPPKRSPVARFSALLVLLAACSSSSEPSSASTPEAAPARTVACARLSACSDFSQDTFRGTITGYDACVAGLSTSAAASDAVPAADCVLKAADCSSALACIHASSTAACSSPQSSCEGDRLRGCFAGIEVSRDCALEGLACIDNGNFVCGTPSACTSSRCEGDRLFSCVLSESYEVAQDCEPGLCQVDSETGLGRCLPSLELCERGSDHCEGDTAVHCSEGYATRQVCEPGRCKETDGAFCSTPEPCISTCDDTTLLSCVDGIRRERIDCTLWSTGCVEEPSGARCAALD